MPLPTMSCGESGYTQDWADSRHGKPFITGTVLCQRCSPNSTQIYLQTGSKCCWCSCWVHPLCPIMGSYTGMFWPHLLIAFQLLIPIPEHICRETWGFWIRSFCDACGWSHAWVWAWRLESHIYPSHTNALRCSSWKLPGYWIGSKV